jgi:hypothetical protein
MDRLGYDRKFWFFVDGLACLRILEPVELESLTRDGGPPEEAELVLLGGALDRKKPTWPGKWRESWASAWRRWRAWEIAAAVSP